MIMAVRPIDGQPVRVLLADLDRTFWWGSDADGDDIVAMDGGVPMTWSSPEQAAVMADGSAKHDDTDAATLDLRPIGDWLAGRSLRLDPIAALNLWNFAGDVAHTLGVPARDRGRIADHCYDKLVAANIPWLADRARCTPRWTKEEHRRLRQHLADASALLIRVMTARSSPGAGRLRSIGAPEPTSVYHAVVR